ncbi:hypothetical protein AABB24_038733 [Solanum stoloniferum]|uniref:Uncharacterized protein n=1 Tax=Solanum stoloniferum TaxID=62892 RepID=A0ABD2R042_9SOLN
MSILEFVPSPNVQTSQLSNEVVGPSNLKRKAKDKHVALIDEDEDELESEDENETSITRTRAISEAKTRLQMKKLHQLTTGSRKINFRGDESLPYSPRKLTWKGKSCVTSNQLAIEKEKTIGKLNPKRGKH